jgi:hypothetical protein
MSTKLSASASVTVQMFVTDAGEIARVEAGGEPLGRCLHEGLKNVKESAHVSRAQVTVDVTKAGEVTLGL